MLGPAQLIELVVVRLTEVEERLPGVAQLIVDDGVGVGRPTQPLLGIRLGLGLGLGLGKGHQRMISGCRLFQFDSQSGSRCQLVSTMCAGVRCCALLCAFACACFAA